MKNFKKLFSPLNIQKNLTQNTYIHTAATTALINLI